MLSELVIGVDEAGLGPVLGPLSMAYFASCRTFDIQIKDSKQLHKKGNLTPLVSACSSYFPGFGLELFKHRDIDIMGSLEEPWFRPSFEMVEAASCPIAFEHERCDGQRMVSVSMGVSAYNDRLSETDNKSEVVTSLLGVLVQDALIWGRDHGRCTFWIDRQGGRKRYGPLVESWGVVINTREEGVDRSRYRGHVGDQPVEFNFKVKGDQSQHVIAAASCFAKLRREMAMEAMNAWWRQRVEGLKPTAGYWKDGLRFLRDVECFRRTRKIDLRALRRNK